jgi:hypothetical protein
MKIWQVISDVSLNIVSLTATDTRVTQGQSGLAVSLEISNTGETGAVIGSADSIGITFLANNNTVTQVSPALPDTILPSTSRTYNFTVDINPSAATGIDSLAGFVIGRNVRTDAVSSISSGYLDGWDVQTPANIVLTSVFNSLSQINSGQEDLSVEVRLTNSGQATALLDTVGIFSLPGGNITDTMIRHGHRLTAVRSTPIPGRLVRKVSWSLIVSLPVQQPCPWVRVMSR